MEIDALTLFFTLLFSYIAKDFYDLFLKHYIIKYMKKYKKLISNNKKGFKI
jgi:hypothetical protein